MTDNNNKFMTKVSKYQRMTISAYKDGGKTYLGDVEEKVYRF